MLPVRAPEQLVLFSGARNHYGSNSGGNMLSFPMYEDFRDNFVDRGSAPALPRVSLPVAERGAVAEDLLGTFRAPRRRDERRLRGPDGAHPGRAGLGNLFPDARRGRGNRPADRSRRRPRSWRELRGRPELRLLAEPLQQRSSGDRRNADHQQLPIHDHRGVRIGVRRRRHRVRGERPRACHDESAGHAKLGRHREPAEPVGKRIWPAEARRHAGASARCASALLSRHPRAGSARARLQQDVGVHARAISERRDVAAAGVAGTLASPPAAHATARAADGRGGRACC